jgi:hypothetical protein
VKVVPVSAFVPPFVVTAGRTAAVFWLTGVPLAMRSEVLNHYAGLGTRYLCVWREPAISTIANVATLSLSFAAFDDYILRVTAALCDVEWLEVEMAMSRKEMRGSRTFALPLFGIVALLASYVLLTDWQQVPRLISSVIAAIH